jgi:surface polysaccharide O-acyltransferase-like enzyme
MAPLPVYLGALIRRSHLNITIPFATLAVLGCWIAIIAEEELIGFVAKRYPESHNAVVATFGLGVSLFLLSQALPRSDAIEKLARLGRISLGVYALHLLIIINLAPILGQQDVLRVLTIAAVTFTVATLVSVALARQRLTRPLVA